MKKESYSEYVERTSLTLAEYKNRMENYDEEQKYNKQSSHKERDPYGGVGFSHYEDD